MTLQQVTGLFITGYLLRSGSQNQQSRMTEHELIRGIIARDRAAVTCLVETYQKRVIKTAYYFLGNMDDAEDVAQEVFLEIVNSMHKFRQSSTLSTWIYRISINRSLNAVKRNKRGLIFVRIETIFGTAQPGKINPVHEPAFEDNLMVQNEAGKLLKETVSGLPENQRIVFILSKYEEMSYKEIAEVTGYSISAIESLLHRAKLKLQKKLICYFSEYSKK